MLKLADNALSCTFLRLQSRFPVNKDWRLSVRLPRLGRSMPFKVASRRVEARRLPSRNTVYIRTQYSFFVPRNLQIFLSSVFVCLLTVTVELTPSLTCWTFWLVGSPASLELLSRWTYRFLGFTGHGILSCHMGIGFLGSSHFFDSLDLLSRSAVDYPALPTWNTR